MKSTFFTNPPGPRQIVISIVLIAVAVLVGVSIIPGTEQEKPADKLQSNRFGTAESLFSIDSTDIDESSGLAASIRYDRCFWTHNDNGGNPGLFLIGPNGKHLATVQIKGVDQRDWESIAIFFRDNRFMIAIANVGDNFAAHETCQIFLIEEPIIDLDQTAKSPEKVSARLDQTISFRYPDGPQDCEAMAYDTAADRFWFVSKQRPGGPGTSIAGGKNGKLARTAVHFVEWPKTAQKKNQAVVATKIDSQFNALFVTGMDISADDRVAVVRTPLQAFLFDRAGNESWQEAFSGSPSANSVVPFQMQGEAICFSRDGKSLWLTSEGVGQPVWRIPLAAPPSN